MDGLSRIDELQQKFSENPRRYFAPLANEYRKAGNTKRAIAICREHLAQMPGHMSGQIVYGQALFEGGEYEEAEKVFEGALKLDPENLIALRTLGDLALRTGDNAEARTRYLRLLEADPKDSTVIALVSEIDASLEASPSPTLEPLPPIDTDGGDNADVVGDKASEPVEAELSPVPEPALVEVPTAAVEAASTEDEPLGLERHYPTEEIAPDVEAAAPAMAVSPDVEPAAPAMAVSPEPVSDAPAVDTHDAPVEEASTVPETPATEWQGTAAPPDLDEDFDERDRTSDLGAPDPADENATESTLEVTAAALDDPFDTWAPPSGAPLNEVSATAPEEPSPVEASVEQEPEAKPAAFNPEPFVNETMAQLYLQQGHPVLALSVYRQLAETRPDEPRFREKVRELEEQADAPKARRDDPPSVESPSPERESPRAPSIESPTAPPATQPGSVETPDNDRSPIDSPPSSTPPSEGDSVESPGRDEPRAEPEGIAARQPSVKEFFATLGRRRPPASGNGSSGPPRQSVVRGGSDTLDSVFAGATVSAEDDRAASALAGAFTRSGVDTEPRAEPATANPAPAPAPTAPPPESKAPATLTPPRRPSMTPRANAALESEEDVAKFRAWLDGLTGE